MRLGVKRADGLPTPRAGRDLRLPGSPVAAIPAKGCSVPVLTTAPARTSTSTQTYILAGFRAQAPTRGALHRRSCP